MAVDEKQTYTMLFNEYDFEGRGNLNFKEFQCVMKHVHNDFTHVEIKTLFKKMDLNTNGVIEYEEFIKGLLNHSLLHK